MSLQGFRTIQNDLCYSELRLSGYHTNNKWDTSKLIFKKSHTKFHLKISKHVGGRTDTQRLTSSIFASQGSDPLLSSPPWRIKLGQYATDIVRILYISIGVTGYVPIRLNISTEYRLGIWRSIDHL